MSHSDCEGDIPWTRCEDIAKRLDQIVAACRARDSLIGSVGPFGAQLDWFILPCERFATGLRRAHERQENVEFE